MIKNGRGLLKQYCKYALFSLLPLVVLVSLAESTLWAWDIGRPVLWQVEDWTVMPMPMMEADEFTIIRPKPDFQAGNVSLNHLGCRDNQFNRNADIKILTLGDSVAFGWGLPDYRDTYSEQLEKMLSGFVHKKNLTVEVLNGGVPSHNLYQGFQFYLHYLAEVSNWDIVILSFGWNEPLGDNNALEFARRHRPTESWLIQSLLRQTHRLRIYNVLESYYLRYTATPGGERNVIVYDEYTRLIKDLIKTLLARNSKVVLLSVQPRQEDKGNAAEQAMIRFNNIQREQVVPGKVVYVDSNPLFAKYRPDYYDPYHFNKQGHRLTAEALYKAITTEFNLCSNCQN